MCGAHEGSDIILGPVRHFGWTYLRLLFCVKALLSAKKQNVSITCVKFILVRLSHKIVVLDLAPFSEKVENHRYTQIVHRSL